MGKQFKVKTGETIAMSTYMDEINDEVIRINPDVQRSAGQMENGMVDGLLHSVLSNGFIPEIVFAEQVLEDGTIQIWLIDGLQRTYAMMQFKGNLHTIGKALEDYIVTYQRKVTDENGKAIKDKNNNYVYEVVEYDIRGKKYCELPKELKTRFDRYQVRYAQFEGCTMEDISNIIRKLNNHKAMNVAQRAFTYIDKFAVDCRCIINDTVFFINNELYTKEKKKGSLERMVVEAIALTYHKDEWKSQTQALCQMVNENATKEEFDTMREEIEVLGNSMSKEAYKQFTMKNSFIWFAVLHEFMSTGLSIKRFIEFIEQFDKVRDTEINGRTFNGVDDNRSTKKRHVVVSKYEVIVDLMYEYFDGCEKAAEEIGSDVVSEPIVDIVTGETIEEELTEIESDEPVEVGGEQATENSKEELLEFVKMCVRENETIEAEDIEYYEDELENLTLNVDNTSALLESENHKSLVAIVGYAYAIDEDIEEWIVRYFANNCGYLTDQYSNYLAMRNDLLGWIDERETGNAEITAMVDDILDSCAG